MELRRMRGSLDPYGRRRELTGYGRFPEIPPQWLIEMDETGEYQHDGAEEEKETRKETRQDDIREAILALLPPEAPGLTRKEIWDGLPDELKTNEVRFKSILEAEVGKRWKKEKLPGKSGAFAYHL